RLDKLQETVELIKDDLKVIKGILMQKNYQAGPTERTAKRG
ncbi:3464_t:CDS:1, partial [Funneliformis caledonium]